jgi:hypothetical protein
MEMAKEEQAALENTISVLSPLMQYVERFLGIA